MTIIRWVARMFWRKAFFRRPSHVGPYGDEFFHGRVWRRSHGLSYRLHRRHGPALEYSDGNKSWYIDGVNYITTFEMNGPVIEYEHWSNR